MIYRIDSIAFLSQIEAESILRRIDSPFLSALANTLQLSSVFHNADITPNLVTERLALFECDADGDIEVDPNGNNTFYLSEGYLYQSGHGRMKCQLTCLDSMDVPNNCGFHQQFYFLVHFKPCGPRCQGGFCPCLRRYPDY